VWHPTSVFKTKAQQHSSLKCTTSSGALMGEKGTMSYLHLPYWHASIVETHCT